jgi:UDP-N-acetylglucosamine--N-acetylmuramyl-(pentapeptide) pyrophosphoryl-undecaprenol N-acetylglucosamine transferase
MEKGLIEAVGIPYKGIASGKLRRYFSLKNLSDPFRVQKGFEEAKAILKEFQPDIVFSKGGFVSVPVVMAAKAHKVPIVIHESDMTPGLATKLCLPHAKKACTTFKSTAENLGKKGVCTGTPLRNSLLHGSAEIARKKLNLDDKPVILIMGGSLGAKAINDNIRKVLDRILPLFNIVHICGKGKTDESINKKGYIQLEYVNEELPDIMALSDIVISRAGSNSINEFLALNKPMLLIPLSKEFSRGDQIDNTLEFESLGYCKKLFEEDITEDLLVSSIKDLYDQRTQFSEVMKNSGAHKGCENVLDVIMASI